MDLAAQESTRGARLARLARKARKVRLERVGIEDILSCGHQKARALW